MNRLLLPASALLSILLFHRNPVQSQEDGHYVLGGTRLAPGDLAPALDVREFVRGRPIARFEPGTVYVLEFWKTGCPPCRAAIAHLNELQKKYPAAVFISVGVYSPTEENIAYVKRSGGHMGYRVAVDRVPDGKDPYTCGAMVQGWLEPSGEAGVPTSFIVGPNGRIAWIGHPTELDEAKAGRPLTQVVAGLWDWQGAAAKAAARRGPDDRQRMKRLPQAEQVALEAIEKQTGRVGIDIRDNTVTGLSLDPRHLTDRLFVDLIGHLQKLKGLRHLDLGNASIGDEALVAVGKLHALTILDLGHTQVTDNGLAHLGNLHELWVLNLQATRITGTGLSQLGAHSKLQTLDLSGAPISAQGLKSLRRLRELHVLNLAGSPLSDEILSELSGMNQLHGLDLSGTPISDAGLKALNGMTLGNLSLAHTRVEGPGLREVHDLVGVLKLNHSQVTDAGLHELNRFANLRRLVLDATQVTDKGFTNWTANRGLRSLSLSDTGVSDVILAHLRNARDLEVLELAGTKVTDDAFAVLKGFQALTFLDVARTGVTKAGAARARVSRPDLLIAN